MNIETEFLKRWSYDTVDDDKALEALIGQSFSLIEKDNDEIRFQLTDGRAMLMWHQQDCCESVYVEDVSGNLEDLLNTPILVAESRSRCEPDGEWGDSQTWTFYTFRTIKGTVDIRWHGSSNGYYGEGVDVRLGKEPENSI